MVREGLKNLLIRDMVVEDIPAVVEIENMSFSVPWTPPLFFGEIKKYKGIPKTALVGERPVGYVCASLVLDEGQILDLAVHPEFRGLGIGAALVGDVLETLVRKGCARVFLEVRVSNPAAIRLYERFGFLRIGVRKNYYKLPDEDAIVMELKTGPSES